MGPESNGPSNEPDTSQTRSSTRMYSGGDWLSVLLIAALLIVILAKSGLNITSLSTGVTALLAPIAIIIAAIAAVRRLSPVDKARMERLRILERVLESDDRTSDPYLKRRALEAIISEGQVPALRRPKSAVATPDAGDELLLVEEEEDGL